MWTCLLGLIELTDEANFRETLQAFLTTWKGPEKQFVEYFKTTYCSRLGNNNITIFLQKVIALFPMQRNGRCAFENLIMRTRIRAPRDDSSRIGLSTASRTEFPVARASPAFARLHTHSRRSHPVRTLDSLQNPPRANRFAPMLRNTPFVDVILRHFPNALFVRMHRNPADVVASVSSFLGQYNAAFSRVDLLKLGRSWQKTVCSTTKHLVRQTPRTPEDTINSM